MRLGFSGNMFLLALALAVSQHPAKATLFTIADGNSTATVDTSSSAPVQGMNSWTIDGKDILYQQWFWYATGSNVQKSISTLNLQSATTTGDQLKLTFGDGATLGTGTFNIKVNYTLVGGQVGSNTADIGEQIAINNLLGTALTFHFYQYSDFDLAGVGQTQHDTIHIDASKKTDTAEQSGNGLNLTEESNTTATPAPTRYEAGIWPNTLNCLNAASVCTLNNNADAGPGDATWAFQWDLTIAGHGTTTISKDKNVFATAVPEPTALLLFGGCLLFLGRKLSSRLAA